MEVAILAALILLNGAFAMSELALISARSSLLQAHLKDGDPGAAAALQLKHDPTSLLSTVQIGITCIGILSGIVGAAALAPPDLGRRCLGGLALRGRRRGRQARRQGARDAPSGQAAILNGGTK